MLVLTRLALKRGIDLKVNMLGRWAVWPMMFSIFLAMVVETWVSDRPAVRRAGDDACGPPRSYMRDGADEQTLKLDLRCRAILASSTASKGTALWTPFPISGRCRIRS